MDPTPLQQTVMEPAEVASSTPQEDEQLSKSPSASPDINLQVEQQLAYEPLSYDELFPALPNAAPVVPAPVVEAPATNWTMNSDMRIASSVITQVFRVPYEERAKIDEHNQFGESASSRICADITTKTGAHIEISSAKDQSLTFLVTGKNDAVLRARRLILEKFQTQARHIVIIPKEHHKFILGKKGKKLQDIETTTTTKIQVPSASDTSEEIVILGPKDSIEKAVHEIRLISDEQSKQAYEKLDIPKSYHPFICGANNEVVNKMMNENNVRINLPPLSVMKNELTIAGEKEGVLKCKDIINKIYKDMESKCKTVSVEVRKSQHRYVIGPRGSNINEILAETSVSVEMPPNDSTSETITLRGPSEKLGSALTMVYAKANSIMEAEVEAPHWLHKFIIGRKGANIKQITQDLAKVHVEFQDKQGVIKLEGPPEEVDTAKEKLETMISEMKERLAFDQLPVDPKHYKHIIGKYGANINRIRKETGAIINISEAGSSNIINLEGSPDGVAEAKKQLIDLVSKKENEKERDIIIENHLHRSIIGSKGSKIQEIRDKFNQVQIIFPEFGKKSDIVTIRGPKDDVDKCYQHLHRHVRKLQESNFQLKVPVYRQCYKHIIGKGGSNINKIREETNTRIELPTDVDSNEITITGKKEDCEKARDHINKIQTELDNIVGVDIIIPSKFHNSMIGMKGKLVQSISEDCGGVSIKFPRPESNSDKVTIRGPKEDVQKAKQMLVELSNEKQLASFTQEVKAKPQHHRFLIGKNGANIRKIKEATGARIVFPSENDEDKELITIIGKKESVLKAKEQLQAVIRDLEKLVEITMTVDPKHYRHFVARRGEVLHQISERYGGVTISFPRSGVNSDQVTLKGAKDCVEAAKASIQEIVDDLNQVVTMDAIIPQKYHRSVMGARGSRVQAITSEHKVQIKFPDKDMANDNNEEGQVNGEMNGEVRPQDIVRIIGKDTNCQEAKDALLALIPITIEVPVPFIHHKYIIGQKGERVRGMMMDHDVNILVPPAQDQSNIIKITGPKANVECAKTALEKTVVQLEEDEEDRKARSHVLEIAVDPEYHPKIIGKRGTVVTKIREKYGVNIQFPVQGENIITITGYEKNCEEAKAAILEITGDLDKMVRVVFDIDSRVHSRLIGSRGRSIKKIMDEYKVEIKFPRRDDNPNEVTIVGMEEAVEECKDRLLNLAEEYLQDVYDDEEMKQYESSSATMQHTLDLGGNNENKPGFVVKGAPWAQQAPNMNSSEDFPSMGAPSIPAAAPTPAWGPRR